MLINPSAEFQDLIRHLTETADLRDPQRSFQSASRDAAAWVDAIDRVIRTVHHHMEIPAEQHGYLVPTRIHLKKSAFPEYRAGTCPFSIAIRVGEKVVSSERLANAHHLNEIYYFITSALSRLCIALYDESKLFGCLSGTVAQTINQASDTTNDLKLNIDQSVYLQTNISGSKIFPRALAAAEAAIQTTVPNDALLFLAFHFKSGNPENNIPKDPARAAELLTAAASDHQPIPLRPLALTTLGEMYFDGQGVEKSYEEAAKCFNLAAQDGWAQALYFAGTRYLHGQGVEKDLDRAQELIIQAADLGISDAREFLAEALYNGDPFDRDLQSALKHSELLVATGNKSWELNCGLIAFELGDFVTAKAYLQGNTQNPRAHFALGSIYLQQENDPQEAMKLFERGVRAGRDDCRWELGLLYFNQGNHEKGCELMETAAFNSYSPAENAIVELLQQDIDSCPHCQYTMGRLHQRNNCVPLSIDEAKKYYQMAISGSTEAQHQLACILDGEGDGEASASLWKRAADAGHVEATYCLGCAYIGGDGIEQSREEAMRCWRIALGQGHPGAAGYLASTLLAEGGDLEEIVALYKQASRAANRYPVFAYQFGEMYQTGNRVGRDFCLAHKHLCKAASEGFAPAQYSLAILFEDHGVDPEQASYWLQKAADQGHEAALQKLAGPEQADEEEEEQVEEAKAVALFSYEADSDNELSFTQGDVLTLTQYSPQDSWWFGYLGDASGFVPSNLVLIQPESNEDGSESDGHE